MVLILLALKGQSWHPDTRLVFMQLRKIPVLLEDETIGNLVKIRLQEDVAVCGNLVVVIDKWIKRGWPPNNPMTLRFTSTLMRTPTQHKTS
jgi:hypothetical protein